MASHSSTLAWKISHGRRSLVGCSPWGREESDTTERLHFQFSLSCIGEGNGNPLQCSCLKNPRDGGAWWAAVDGVTQSWTRLKRLSNSSSSHSLLQGIFLTQGLNPGLPHCRRILYQLSHKESPKCICMCMHLALLYQSGFLEKMAII